jgi:nucleoside-diphosphate-sugar epimerase
MRILVTGAGGFIGKALVKALQMKAHVVFELKRADGSMRDAATFGKFSEEQIDHVFHLAASGTIPESWENTPGYLDNIVVGTSRVLDFCKTKNASYTYISSYMYGMPQYLPIDEEHPMGAANPYALSKRISEEICLFYSREFGLKGTLIRPFVIFGEGQKENFLISSLIKQVLESEVIQVNDLTPKKRDYLYISDFISALLKTLEGRTNPEVFNIGMGVSYTIPEIIDLLQDIAGTNKMVTDKGLVRKNDYPDVVASISKAATDLNWKPQIDMRQALTLCIKAHERK